MTKVDIGSAGTSKLKSVPVVLLTLIFLWVNLTIYTPHLIYFSQREFFGTDFFSLISATFLYGLVLVPIVGFLLLLLPYKLMRMALSVLMVLTVLIWFQVDYFAISYGALDGAGIDFSHYQSRGNLELIVLSVSIIAALLLSEFVIKNGAFVILLILMGQLSLVGLAMFQEPDDKTVSEQVEVDPEFHRYSSEKNIILIIMDTFGSEYFQEIYANDESTVSHYNGFTGYTDAISNYPATRGSLPSMLTGKMIPENESFKSFSMQQLESIGLPKMFEGKGYHVSVMSTTNWLKSAYAERYLSEVNVSPEKLKKYHSYQLLDYALFRASIHYLKPKVYNKGQWLISRYVSNETEIPNSPSERGKKLIEYVAENAEVDGAEPRFKVIHLTIPHPEYVYDRNCQINDQINEWPTHQRMLEQSECALLQLNMLLDKFRSMGVYDNSLIVVSSDHGARVFDDHDITGFPSQFELNASGILFMIKGIGQTGDYQEVDQPFSLIKLYQALLDKSLHHSDYSQLKDGDRKFYAYQNWYTSAKGYLQDAPLYRVGANYREPMSWELIGYGANNCKAEPLPLTMTFKTHDREGYCLLLGFDRPNSRGNGTWTASEDMRIVFNLSLDESSLGQFSALKLKFKSMLFNGQDELNLNVYLNGELIGKENIKDRSLNELDFKFPSDILLEEKNVLQFVLPGVKSKKELDLGNDPKKRGVFLEEVYFE